MKQSIQLTIPTPCHENWNKMTTTEQGRFCLSCKKEVVDFSSMTDKEVLNYFSGFTGNTCGRIHNDQLDRVITAPSHKRRFSFKYFWSLLITSFLISYRSVGQAKTTKGEVVCTQDTSKIIVLGGIRPVRNPAINIKGKVVDEKNEPLPGATILLKGTTHATITDKNGNFIFRSVNPDKKITLQVSYVGYISESVDVSPANIKPVITGDNSIAMEAGNIMLNRVATTMGIVAIAPSNYKKGKVVPQKPLKTISPIEKIKNIFTGNTTNAIKVFPNPVAVNSNFNIAFNIKTPGEYNIILMDMSGKTIVSKQLNIQYNNQTETFSSNGLLSGGIYVITIEGKDNKKIYSTKLIAD